MSKPIGIKIRKANNEDIAFLVEAITEADKSGSNNLSYATIFSLTEEAVRSLLAEILAEDIQGQELCVSSFDIAEVNGQVAATACSWIEGCDGQSSSLLKATLLNHFVPPECMKTAIAKKDILFEVAIEKPRGALILESVYTRPQFRRTGIFRALLEAKINTVHEQNPDVHTCALTVMKTNQSALIAYERAGFRIVSEKTSHDPQISKLLASDTRILMEKTI